MEQALRARRAAQRYVTTLGETIVTQIDSLDVGDRAKIQESLPSLRLQQVEFQKVVQKYELRQEQVEEVIDEERLDQDIIEALDYKRKNITPVLLKLEHILRVDDVSNGLQLQDGQNVNNSATFSQDVSHHSSARLPKFTLPSFGGEIREWTSFWEQFEVMVENDKSIPEISKFSYLRSALKGDAQATIAGLALTAANYKTAKELLRGRYGRRETIIFTHVQDLLELRVTAHPTVRQIWDLYDQLQSHTRSLAALGIGGEEYGVILTPLVLSRLPTELRMEWARVGKGHESDLKHLLDFLKAEVERRERSQVFASEGDSASAATGSALVSSARQGSSSSSSSRPASSSSPRHSSSSSASSSRSLCGWCNKPGHELERCFALKNLPNEEKRQKLLHAGYCLKCLHKPSRESPHSFKECKVCCKVCNGGHNEFIHTSKPKPDRKRNTPHEKTATSMASSSASSSSPISDSDVLLQTLEITVEGKGGKVKVNALFDTGADRTYVSESVVQKVKPEWVETRPLSYASFGADSLSKTEDRHVYSLCLQGGDGRVPVNATCIPSICVPVSKPSIPSHLLLNSELSNVVTVSPGGQVKIDVLIGLDMYWRIMTGPVRRLSPDLVAQKSKLGWVVSGAVPSSGGNSVKSVSHQLLCQGTCIPAHESFWDLESIGIVDKEEASKNAASDQVWSTFEETITHEGGRYSVSLPWKEGGREILASNRASALKRLHALTNRFERDPELGQRYHSVISEMWQEGIIEEVDGDVPASGLEFYLPHHPVVKEESLTTKVRPVFDASAKSVNGISLNDCMEAGPNLLPDLVGVLIRFRRWQFALTADVRKAFLQVGVDEKDRDAHRFFWNDVGTVRIMRFTRVPFGNKGSPFLLMATIRHHLVNLLPTKVSQELKDNLYMDDWLSGCDDEKEAFAMFSEAQEIMNTAGMELAKWASNSKDLSERIKGECQSAIAISHKVLGLEWSMLNDMFSFKGFSVSTDTCVTKRLALSLISRLFDPMGFLNPFVIRAKILFQTIWRQGLSWDELLPNDLQQQFRKWLLDLSVLRQWAIPRRFFSINWSQNPKLTVHGFGDASESAYGACIYLVAERADGSSESAFVISRARVAPLKKVTLPRLELLGALLCARLISYVKRELKLDASFDHFCWTDSTVVLAWIKSDPSRWKTFVSNRVTEIHSLVEPSRWNHCQGKCNPADLVTRGVSADELSQSKLWLQGPTEVMTQLKSEKLRCSSTTTLLTCIDLLSQSDSVSPKKKVSEPIMDVSRHSSLIKSMRVMARVLRFIHNCRHPAEKKEGELTFSELSLAKLQILRDAQKVYSEDIDNLREKGRVSNTSQIIKLSPFLCEDGLLRVKGRLQFAGLSENSTHPVIVPKGHLSLLLARHIHVTMKHAGVNCMLVELRNNYWVIGARRTCGKVKKNCVHCQRFDSPILEQPMAPLPKERVTQASPFSVSGLDHTGHLLCGDFPGSKFYILLFTCAVTRAVHLELVNSLSSEETLLALRRFFARRGTPSILWSDNAKGFLAARSKLFEVMGSDGPEWRLIPPRAPWWGGFWERMIGSIKSSLKKTLGRQCLCRQELQTLLQEVESCVNSRPLTYVGDGLDSCRALTPNHFLLGRTSHKEKINLSSVPEIDTQQLVRLFENHSETLSNFWVAWREEYLKNLPPFKGKASENEISIGKVVFIEDEGPRLGWPLGIVKSVYPGKDGLIRKVDLKTSRGIVSRPVQRLRQLEIPDCPSSEITPQDTSLKNTPQNTSSENIPPNKGLKAKACTDIDSKVDSDFKKKNNTCATLPKDIQTRSGRRVHKRERLDL